MTKRELLLKSIDVASTEGDSRYELSRTLSSEEEEEGEPGQERLQTKSSN
jgi:hypothetical protein